MSRNVVVAALILAILALIMVVPRLIRGEAAAATVGAAAVATLVALHGVEALLGAHLRRRSERRTLSGIRDLIDMAGSADATPRNARKAFRRISKKARLQPILLAQPDLVSAAGTRGPHQVHLLRLILVHLWPTQEPWKSLVAEGEEVLLHGELSKRELGFLPAWQEAMGE